MKANMKWTIAAVVAVVILAAAGVYMRRGGLGETGALSRPNRPMKLGVYRASMALISEDVDGDMSWSSDKDRTGGFGQAGDILVLGDWDGSGATKVGVFRPSSGLWALDMNGNLQWDAETDK